MACGDGPLIGNLLLNRINQSVFNRRAGVKAVGCFYRNWILLNWFFLRNLDFNNRFLRILTRLIKDKDNWISQDNGSL